MTRRRSKAKENPLEIPFLLAILAAGAVVTGGVVVAVNAKKNADAAANSLPNATAVPAESTENINAANNAAAQAAASAAADAASANAGTVGQNILLASLPTATQTYTFTAGAQINLVVGDTLNLLSPAGANPGNVIRFLISGGNGLQTVAWNATPAGASEVIGTAATLKAVSPGQFTVSLDQVVQGTNPVVTPGASTLTVSISSGAALTLGP